MARINMQCFLSMFGDTALYIEYDGGLRSRHSVRRGARAQLLKYIGGDLQNLTLLDKLLHILMESKEKLIKMQLDVGSEPTL